MLRRFDSVSHESITRALAAWGADRNFVTYIEHLYASSTTQFQIPGLQEEFFHPTCGVRQGDPLSPLLFNLVLDALVKQLKATVIGVNLSGARLAVSAYADDIILFASTKQGLQHNLDLSSRLLKCCNLAINPNKSFALSVLGDGKNKKSKVINAGLEVDGAPLPSIGVGQSFKYLGL